MAILFGDTPNSLNKKQHGGNQTLIGNDPTNSLFGDAGLNLLDKAHGGDDISRETYEYSDVSALGITDFSQLNVSAFDPTTHESTITFSAGNEVVVHSQIALTERDFLFA